jgi:hypothetical protein
MGILVIKHGASDGSGNQLIAWAKTCYLLQTQVPELEFGTWRNPVFCRIWDLQRSEFQYFLEYPVHPPGYSSYHGYGNLLAERIHVCMLGHAGWIQRSYLHDFATTAFKHFIAMTRLENQNFTVSLVWLFQCLKYLSCLLQLVANPSRWEW